MSKEVVAIESEHSLSPVHQGYYINVGYMLLMFVQKVHVAWLIQSVQTTLPVPNNIL